MHTPRQARSFVLLGPERGYFSSLAASLIEQTVALSASLISRLPERWSAVATAVAKLGAALLLVARDMWQLRLAPRHGTLRHGAALMRALLPCRRLVVLLQRCVGPRNRGHLRRLDWRTLAGVVGTCLRCVGLSRRGIS